jgi:hypothetical protein
MIFPNKDSKAIVRSINIIQANRNIFPEGLTSDGPIVSNGTIAANNTVTVNSNLFVTSGNMLTRNNSYQNYGMDVIMGNNESIPPTQVLNGNIWCNPTNAVDNRILYLPSAASIINSIPNCQVGTGFRFTINTKNYKDNNQNPLKIYLVGKTVGNSTTAFVNWTVPLDNLNRFLINCDEAVTFTGRVLNINQNNEVVNIFLESKINFGVDN